jgi:protein TonB
MNPATDRPQLVNVYAVGPDVSAPELIPLALSPFSPVKCIEKVDGKVALSLLVDTAGRPRNIAFVHPVGTEVDAYALRIAEADRFKPGSKDGNPVVVAQSLDLAIHSCLVASTDSSGRKAYRLTLTSAPEQTAGPFANPPQQAVLSSGDGLQGDADPSAYPTVIEAGVAPPVPLYEPEVEFSDQARKNRISGMCTFSLVVDAHGMPWNVQETQKLGYGLDEIALAAVARYRFKPATKDGQPIPVKIRVEVSFRYSGY